MGKLYHNGVKAKRANKPISGIQAKRGVSPCKRFNRKFKEPKMALQTTAAIVDTEDTDTAAVTELVSDIEAELRLHLARVLEFLDGTGDIRAVTESQARARLIRISDNLRECIADISDI
jgi:hypothetical protein